MEKFLCERFISLFFRFHVNVQATIRNDLKSAKLSKKVSDF